MKTRSIEATLHAADSEELERVVLEIALAATKTTSGALFLASLLVETNGNVREAARVADVDAVTMYRLLAKRGLSRTRA